MKKSILERYEEAHAAFMRGDLDAHDNDQLLMYLSGLANQNNTNTGTQHRDVIRGLTINNILLKRHIDKLQSHISTLNAQNARTQVLVIALTIASLFGSAAQIWYAYRADAKEERAAVASVEATRTQVQLPASPPSAANPAAVVTPAASASAK